MREVKSLLGELRKHSKFEWLLIILLVIYVFSIKINESKPSRRYPAGYPSQLLIQHDSNGEVFILN